MKVILYYCEICKKRIRKNQKVYFGFENQYHFKCKCDLPGYKGRKLREFLFLAEL